MAASRRGQALIGAAFVIALIVLARLAIGQFNHEFTRSIPLTVHAPRAGLLLSQDSPVKLRGVVVGRVGSVHPVAHGARIGLEIKPHYQHLIPVDAGARVVPPTIFGAKYIELRTEHTTVDQAIQAHTVITAEHVTVETASTFAHLAELLEAVPADKVNAAMTSLAALLAGRGDDLGEFLVEMDAYLAQIEPELKTLEADLDLSRDVARTYAKLTPTFLDLLANLTSTSYTVFDHPQALHRFLVSLRSVSDETRDVLQDNRKALLAFVNGLTPVSGLLAKYSPQVACLIEGIVVALPLAEDSIGGRNPGLTAESSFIPAIEPYRYPRDLPEVKADNPPNCYGLPNVTGAFPPKHKVFRTGRDPYAEADPDPGLTPDNLAELLFGSLRSPGGGG